MTPDDYRIASAATFAAATWQAVYLMWLCLPTLTRRNPQHEPLTFL